MRASQEHGIISHAMQGLVLGNSGVYNFDTVTKTKTVAKLLAMADLAAFRGLIPAIRNAIERPGAVGEKDADAKRRAFADILVSICNRVLAMAKDETDNSTSVTEILLDALIGLAYSDKPLGADGRTFEPPPSSGCRAYFRSRVRSCLDQSIQYRAANLNLLRYTIHRLKGIQEEADGAQALIEFDEKTRGIAEVAWKKIKKISKTVGLVD